MIQKQWGERVEGMTVYRRLTLYGTTACVSRFDASGEFVLDTEYEYTLSSCRRLDKLLDGIKYYSIVFIDNDRVNLEVDLGERMVGKRCST